tara:strand:- start:352 stop:579 length:228 start_codon:yes stop_codon:yes gene_type:complete
MTVINSELTVHCKDVEKAKVIVNHRSYGSIVRFKLDENNTVRIFLDNRDDFNKLFNILSWDVSVEEVANGSEDEK